MNLPSRLHGKSSTFLNRLLATGVSVWLLGVAFTPALAATQSPAVDQTPLIIQKPLPPNITLMLDDSGSMAYDYMPDACYLDGVTCTGTNNGTYNGHGTDSISTINNDAMIAASNNGVYYSPTVTYTPPPKADSTTATPDLYPSYSDITSVPLNGFNPGATVDLTNYASSDVTGESNNQSKPLKYSYTSSTITVTKTMSQKVTTTGTWWVTTAAQACQNLFNSTAGTSGDYQSSYYVVAAPATNPESGTCSFTYAVPTSYFQYATGPIGTYAVNYVSATSSCNGQSNCTLASDTSGAAAPKGVVVGKNIANWFAYYHTRMLAAKSGVMNSFSSVDPTYRVGFGSIDGGQKEVCGSGKNAYYCGNENYKNIPSSLSLYDYVDSYNGGGSNYIAEVQPYTATQKSALWTWISAAKASGGTPLRQALDAVGQYYTGSQPWQTTNADSTTTELACRQSYTILTTDGFWNEDDSDIGTTIGDMDETKAGPIPRPNNLPTFTYNPASPYSGADSNTLADVAMKYWVTDLRTVSNEVPTSKEDPAYWQHMVTFTLGLGFTPEYADGTQIPMDQVALWANGDSTKAISPFTWPSPSANSINNIADLAHAAVNGHGVFASAKTPQEFSQALTKALQRASDRVGTGASLAANSTQLKTGAFAYQANYFTADWSGDLKAIAVNPNDGTLAKEPTWTASSELPTASARKIYTCVACVTTGTTTAAAVAFNATTTSGVLSSGLSSAQLTALGGSDTTAQQNMIDYLRGDKSKEIGQTDGIYRTRTNALGDIVDSQPVYMGQPDANQFVGQTFTGTDSYDSYVNTTRSGLIFVAANDGMLHAFYTDTVAAAGSDPGTVAGAEAYAYLPAAVITTNTSTTRTTSDLTTLADPSYGTTTSVPHKFFNDGELTVADVYFGSAWHTVLVGTTGRGLAKAVYALDVTNPKAITLLWERSAGDGKANADYIGQMIGKPVIAQTNDAGSTDTTGNSNWSVLIGNGYNSKNGSAALLQFAISDGTLNVHKTDDTITGNGLGAPAVWIGDLTNGISTVAYAGDAKGNVWSFGLNTTTVTKGTGKNPDVTTYTSTPTTTGTNLYTAMDGAATPNAQPITAGMLVGMNPTTQDLWLFFGTGQYLSSSDIGPTSTQSWYGLIVQAGSASNSTAVTSSTTRSSLAHRQIVAETPGTAAVVANPTGTPPVAAQAAIAPARAVTPTPATSDIGGKNGKSGWYIDLLSPTSATAADPKDPTKTVTTYTPDATAEGERMVTPNLFQGNQLLATTRIPEAVDLCNPSGRGWIMAVDPFTGTNPTSSFFDLNGDGQINQPADYIMVNGKAVATSGIGFSSLPNNPIFMGGSMLVSFDNGNATSIKTSGTSNTWQRVSWRELINQ